MSLTSVLEAAETSTEHPIDPWAVGAITLVILVALLVGLFAFGKGRDHT